MVVAISSAGDSPFLLLLLLELSSACLTVCLSSSPPPLSPLLMTTKFLLFQTVIAPQVLSVLSTSSELLSLLWLLFNQHKSKQQFKGTENV